MVELVVNGFVPSLVRWIGFDGTVVCVRLRNLELLLLLITLDITQILHQECLFSFLPQCLLAAVAKQTFNGTISGFVAIAAAGGGGRLIVRVTGLSRLLWRFHSRTALFLLAIFWTGLCSFHFFGGISLFRCCTFLATWRWRRQRRGLLFGFSPNGCRFSSLHSLFS